MFSIVAVIANVSIYYFDWEHVLVHVLVVAIKACVSSLCHTMITI